MTRPEQKEDELRWTLYLFQMLGAPIPSSVLPQLEPEPDIVAETNDGAIGIELRELIEYPKASARESEEATILDYAKSIFSKQSTARVQVQVRFNEHWSPEKAQRAEVGTALAKLVLSVVPTDSSSVCLSWSSDNCIELTDSRFDHIRIIRSDASPDSYWVASHGWFAAFAGYDVIQRHIDTKQGKRSLYRKQYSQCWLLLHRSGSAPSSGFEVDDQIRQQHFDSEFDRVFLLTGLGPQLVELTLKRSASEAV